VNSWSNRFASLAVLALAAGCHSTPRLAQPRTPDAEVKAGPSAAVTAPGGTMPGVGLAAPRPTAAAQGGAVQSGAVQSGAVQSGAAPGAKSSASTAPVPDRAAQQYAQALNLMKAGRTSDAELELKQLALAYPEYAGPEVNLGLLYLRNSRYTEAEGAFKAAIQRNPDNAVANNELGIAERKLGKFAEAEAAYQRTIAIEPNYAPAYLNLGVLYDLYMSEPQKALEQFEHYLTLVGENKQVAGWVVELRKRVGAPAPAAKKEPA
jgi:tetratricopeptide (TPR) repeat protein